NLGAARQVAHAVANPPVPPSYFQRNRSPVSRLLSPVSRLLCSRPAPSQTSRSALPGRSAPLRSPSSPDLASLVRQRARTLVPRARLPPTLIRVTPASNSASILKRAPPQPTTTLTGAPASCTRIRTDSMSLTPQG